mgnify:CR=1 FL=1
MKTQHLQFQLVDISSINWAPCALPESVISRIANKMLELGTNLEIPLVLQIGLEEYEIITLPHVYAAAKKAQALDGKFEMIGAMVVRSEEFAILAQEQL